MAPSTLNRRQQIHRFKIVRFGVNDRFAEGVGTIEHPCTIKPYGALECVRT
jgi:hypothetical protein